VPSRARSKRINAQKFSFRDRGNTATCRKWICGRCTTSHQKIDITDDYWCEVTASSCLFLPAACSHQQHGDEEYFLTHSQVGLGAHLLPQLNSFAVHCDAFSSDLVFGLLVLVAGDRDGTPDLELIFW
jgi:hypothetical protein